jgi:hippurate hydrolase
MNRKHILSLAACLLPLATATADPALRSAVASDYAYLGPLFEHFHRHPELSFREIETAKRLAAELRAAGFDVTEGVGGTGVVALMKNGTGPTVMMRADMDGLPVPEKTDLPYASQARQLDVDGVEKPVMHACGHDAHMTALVGTARRMAAMNDRWSGTLMLIGQPAEERLGGAQRMMQDGLWKRFGQPDFALAFHVSSAHEAGRVAVKDSAAYAGADTVDIIVHGVGAHGASPHKGRDPVLIGSQIVVALQTLVSREISPRKDGVVTVGAFHSGFKHNIIPDRAELSLTVRSDDEETRQTLLQGIQRIAINTARAAGLPEDRLPTVTLSAETTPPTINDAALVARLRKAWIDGMGKDTLADFDVDHMGAEDFPYFTSEPRIPSAYFAVGGTPRAVLEAARSGGPAVPSHHSPIFRIAPEPAIRTGVEATVVALLELMPAGS